MADDKVRTLVEGILSDVKQMVICSSSSNKPWAATVFFAFDKDLDLYFFSIPERRHSKEIAANPNVAGVIAREHKKTLEEPARGLQFEGECKLVTENEAKAAYELYQKRLPKITEFHDIEDAPEELHKVTVKNFVLFDTLNFPENSRRELKL